MQVNGNQWKGRKFDLRSHKTPEPMVTEIGMGDDVRTPNPVQNFIAMHPAPRSHARTN